MITNIGKLNESIEFLKATFRDGLLSAAIWEVESGLALAGFNSSPAGVALSGGSYQMIRDALETANYPKIGRYYILELQGGLIALVVQHINGILQAAALNANKVNMGVVLGVAVPRMLADVAAAQAA